MFRARRIEPARDLWVLLMAVLGLYLLAGAGMIKAKAWLAPVLVERAWQANLLNSGSREKPWPWADTWPVARLQAPRQRVDLLVLAGDSGNALAFGPGHAGASAPLGTGGRSVIGGHRDTHFAFLRELQPGDPLQLHLPDGSRHRYQVTSARIVDTRVEVLHRDESADSLLLVTCYPFDALTSNGPLRYAVTALPVT